MNAVSRNQVIASVQALGLDPETVSEVKICAGEVVVTEFVINELGARAVAPGGDSYQKTTRMLQVR